MNFGEWNNISDIVYSIGFYGPLILLVLNIFYLKDQYYVLMVYLIGWIINIGINKCLKVLFRENRPKGNRVSFDMEPEEKYGMPSGHAQSVFFSLTFLFLVNGSYILLYISLFIAALTIYQRWFDKAHSIVQLFVGSIVGAIFAWGYIQQLLMK